MFLETRYVTHDMETGEMVSVYPLDKCLKAIEQRHKDMKDSIERLEAENIRLKEENYKDEELQRMKAEVQKARKALSRGFSISEEEQEQINKWKEQHERDVHNLYTLEDKLKYKGTVGGSYTYEFMPTSIGIIGTIKCSCGEKFTFAEL